MLFLSFFKFVCFIFFVFIVWTGHGQYQTLYLRTIKKRKTKGSSKTQKRNTTKQCIIICFPFVNYLKLLCFRFFRFVFIFSAIHCLVCIYCQSVVVIVDVSVNLIKKKKRTENFWVNAVRIHEMIETYFIGTNLIENTVSKHCLVMK